MLNTYAIIGATGKVGKQATEVLLGAGHHARAIVRNPNSDAAQSLKKSGADIIASGFVEGDEKLGLLSVDEKVLTSAFTDVNAVFAMVPPNLQSARPDETADEYMQVVKRAVKNANVKKLVLLSGFGAHLPSGTGQVEKMYRFEQTFLPLAGPDLRVVVVRASYFFTNLLWSFAAVPHGIFPFPYAVNTVRNMISTQDVGDEVAKQLMDATAGGSEIIELAGPEDYCFADITAKIAELTGKPLQYVQQAPESLVPTYISYGISPAGAESLAGMDAAAIAGILVPEHPEKVKRGTRVLNDWLNTIVKH